MFKEEMNKDLKEVRDLTLMTILERRILRNESKQYKDLRGDFV